MNRRGFLQGAGLAVAATAINGTAKAAPASTQSDRWVEHLKKTPARC